MALDLSPIVTEITELRTVRGSIETLLVRLSALIEANKANPSAISAIAADIKAEAKAFADAGVAHTPAETEPPAPPVPPVPPTP